MVFAGHSGGDAKRWSLAPLASSCPSACSTTDCSTTFAGTKSLTEIPIVFTFNQSIYRMPSPTLLLPLLVPSLVYNYEVDVEVCNRRMQRVDGAEVGGSRRAQSRDVGMKWAGAQHSICGPQAGIPGREHRGPLHCSWEAPPKSAPSACLIPWLGQTHILVVK